MKLVNLTALLCLAAAAFAQDVPAGVFMFNAANAKWVGTALGSGTGDRLEQEQVSFHERVRQGFLSLAQNEPERIRIVDARGTVSDVQREIRRAVSQVLRCRGEGPGREGSR